MDPIFHTVLLCDGLFVEPATRKFFLLGLWTNVNAMRLPIVQPFGVFVQASEVRGEFQGSLRIRHLETGTLLAEAPFTLRTSDPLTIAQMQLSITAPLTMAGAHEIQVVNAKGELLKSAKFTVTLPPAAKPLSLEA